MSVSTYDLNAAIADHRADPHAHPELLQLRQAVTSAGLTFDPADGTQLHTALEQTVDVAVDAAVVTHMIDPAAHAELKQVRQIVSATGMVFDAGQSTQLHSAIDLMIDTNLIAGVAVHKADPFAHPEQKQVRTVITDAGMVYDPADPAQLSAAITHKVVSHAPPDASETVKGVTRFATVEEARSGELNTVAVHPAGLNAALTVKAPLLSPALTGTPTAPTPAAGDASSRIATTAFIKGAMQGLEGQIAGLIPVSAFTGTNQSLTQNGYQKLPGGLILQWGQFWEDTLVLPPGGAVTRSLVFPIGFSSACLQVICCSTLDHVMVAATNLTKTGFTASFSTDTTMNMNLSTRYLAIGF